MGAWRAADSDLGRFCPVRLSANTYMPSKAAFRTISCVSGKGTTHQASRENSHILSPSQDTTAHFVPT